MTVTKFNNRLVTPELREALSDYPLYSQDAKGKDALCIAQCFTLAISVGILWKDSPKEMTSPYMV